MVAPEEIALRVADLVRRLAALQEAIDQAEGDTLLFQGCMEASIPLRVALRQLGGAILTPLLELLVQTPHEYVRAAAAEQLGSLRDPAAIPALVCALADPSDRLRVAAAVALCNFDADRLEAHLTPVLTGEDAWARRAAIEALFPLQRALSESGDLAPQSDPGLDREEVLALYRAMVRMRVVHLELTALHRQARIAFHRGVLGEEASILGSACALRDADWIFPGSREFAAALWRGMPLQRYLDQIAGTANDPAKGRQKPGHFTWRSGRVVSVGSPLGGRTSQAVGLAMAAKARGDDAVALVYLADASTSTSEFHSGMSFAGVFRAPVVFFCHNDRWARSEAAARPAVSDTVVQRGLAYGVRGVRVDGNDVFAVRRVTREAVMRAARGEGPTLVEAQTQGISAGAATVESWRRLDPLVRLRRHLRRRRSWSEADEASLVAELEAEVKQAFAAAEITPPPPVESMFDDVFGEPPWHLVEQREKLLGERRERPVEVR